MKSLDGDHSECSSMYYLVKRIFNQGTIRLFETNVAFNHKRTIIKTRLNRLIFFVIIYLLVLKYAGTRYRENSKYNINKSI